MHWRRPEIARGRLLVEDIPCVLVDRSLLQLGIVADGIELQVPESDLERAPGAGAGLFRGT